MKPPPFSYCCPLTLEDAIGLLAEGGSDVKVLAGGQSLVPLLNLRLIEPRRLVDISRLTPLTELHMDEAGGWLQLGAMVRQATAERDARVCASAPLLAEALQHVAHPAIRSRGTVVGSAVHADPAAEVPAVLVALDALIQVRGEAGERTIPASEFFLGVLTTALLPGELVTAVRVPIVSSRTGAAWVELARTHGNYAIVGVGCQLEFTSEGTIADARLALCGVADTPVRASQAEGELLGHWVSDALATRAAEAATVGLDPPSDLHASADYRRHLTRVLTERAILLAARRAARPEINGTVAS